MWRLFLFLDSLFGQCPAGVSDGVGPALVGILISVWCLEEALCELCVAPVGAKSALGGACMAAWNLLEDLWAPLGPLEAARERLGRPLGRLFVASGPSKGSKIDPKIAPESGQAAKGRKVDF